MIDENKPNSCCWLRGAVMKVLIIWSLREWSDLCLHLTESKRCLDLDAISWYFRCLFCVNSHIFWIYIRKSARLKRTEILHLAQKTAFWALYLWFWYYHRAHTLISKWSDWWVRFGDLKTRLLNTAQMCYLRYKVATNCLEITTQSTLLILYTGVQTPTNTNNLL